MENFVYHVPTKIVFGKDAEQKIGQLVKATGCEKVLVHFGGGSAQKSGLLARIRLSLEEQGICFILLGGVVPNPRLSKVYEGIELCKREKIDFLLAVGGGSVIDSAKAIALGAANPGADVWSFFDGSDEPKHALPVGSVLTIAAAGSEMSDSMVITKEDGNLKRGCTSELSRCVFSVLNPELTYTLPAFQTACGCTDILMHTMERYFTPVTDAELTDGIAEAVMRTVIKNAKTVLASPRDYNARAQIMWAGSVSHNDITGCGTDSDWATHQLEHELSGMFDIAHGAGLAAVWGSWARYVCKKSGCGRFATYAKQIFGITAATEEQAAEQGICKTEEFFKTIGMPTSISGLGIRLTDAQIDEMTRKCNFFGARKIGTYCVLEDSDVKNIYRAAR